MKRARKKLNEKERIIFVTSLSRYPPIKFPFIIVTSGKNDACEKKFHIENTNDFYLHSFFEWIIEIIMIDYLKLLPKNLLLC